MPQRKKMKQALDTWQAIKQEAKHFLETKNLTQATEKISALIKEKHKDLVEHVDHDLKSVKEKFYKEKKQIEQIVEKVIQDDIKKAKKFLDRQKNELDKLQKNVESIVGGTVQKVKKNAAAKPSTHSTPKTTKKKVALKTKTVKKVTKKKTSSKRS